MAVSVCFSLLLLSSIAESAQNQAEVAPGGTLMGVNRHRNALLRRDADASTPTKSTADGTELLEKLENQRAYGVSDLKTRKSKIARGLASNPYAIYEGEYANDGGSHDNWHAAPAWAPHADMPAMPTCTLDVTQDMGLSDYGTIPHACATCGETCTEENKQQPISMEWEVEPPLHSCNAKEVKIFFNWTDISQLQCTSCVDKGLRHKFEFAFATNAGQDIAGYENRELKFKAWMGPEVTGGPSNSGSSFDGKHVFEVEDTEEPSRSEDCDAANPEGRWLAIQGDRHQGEGFKCERICKSTHTCLCGRNTGMRCTADITMASAQQFAYHIKMIEPEGNGTLDGEHYIGAEWQVTAEDLTQTSPVKVVGRVILAGNNFHYGIKEISQTHEHLGCVPCDLFYESTVVTGPFILDPPGVHVLKAATGYPPTLTDQSCERFRMSAVSGYAVRFETGNGLWPPFEVNDTLFTCDTSTGTTCPAR